MNPHSLQIPDAGLHLGMFLPAETARLDARLDAIARAEHLLEVQRVRIPSLLRDCADARAAMRRDEEGWRLVSDPFADTLEVTARHLFSSYRDLRTLSCVSDLYFQNDRGPAWTRRADALGARLRTLTSLEGGVREEIEATFAGLDADLEPSADWMDQRTVWTLAVYGPTEPDLAAFRPLLDALEGLEHTTRQAVSTVAVRGSDNATFYPSVAILEATLWKSVP